MVVIIGLNLSEVTKVTFGGTEATIVEKDADGTFIKVTAPSHPPGEVRVVLTDGGTEHTGHDGYNYVPVEQQETH